MPMVSAPPATTIAAMGNGMYVMCSNRGVLDQGHIVTGTYFPPLPSSQDHQNLGTNSILTSSSHHHYSAAQQSLHKSNDSNNNKHGSENSNNNNSSSNNSKKINENGSDGKSFKVYKDAKKVMTDDVDDKLIKNDTNNNNHHHHSENKNRLTAASALSPYHHQSYLSQYKSHINYGEQQQHQMADEQQQQQQQQQQQIVDKYSNFVGEYDPYQSNAIYYHPAGHFAHSGAVHAPVSAAPGTFYVTNPEYYHQPYGQSVSVPAVTAPTTTLVQPMVAKIDAVIGATLHHPGQNLMAEAYGTPEQLKEDDFSNILAGVRKTCYSN
jgi:hypothetical protein